MKTEEKKYSIIMTTNGHYDKTQRADTDNTFTDKDEARAKAKRLNKLLSKGEKEYYKLKYKVFAV
jgi:hypothetical protein